MSVGGEKAKGPQAGGAGNVRWFMVFWMFVIAAVSYMDRTNIAIATTAVQKSFGLTDAAMGTVFLAFGLGYAFTQPVAGRLADRFGPRNIIILAVLWWTVFTVATPLVPAGLGYSFALLITVRLLLGIGESVIFPASNRLVSGWVPVSERGLANGIIFAGVGIGAGVATPLIRTIIRDHGWPMAFYLSAGVGVLVLLVWIMTVRDRPAGHPWVKPAELALIKAGLPAEMAESDKPKPATWGQVLRNRQVMLLTACYFAYGYVAWIFFTWFFKYMSTVRHLDIKKLGYVYEMLPFLAMAVASPLGGWLADILCKRFGRRVGRCWLAGFSMILAGILVAIATQVQDVQMAAIFLAGGAGGLYLSQSAFWALSADIGKGSAGSVSGVMNMGNQIAGVITAQVTPIIATGLGAGAFLGWGWNASFLVAASICVVGGLLWFLIDPDGALAET